MKKREEEARKKREAEKPRRDMKIEMISIPGKSWEEKMTEEGESETKNEGVYDLLTLKTCSEIVLQDGKSYPESEDDSMPSDSTEKEEKDQLSGNVFNSLFNELNCRNEKNGKVEASKSFTSHRLLAIEETEEVAEEISVNTSNSEECTFIKIASSDIDILKPENSLGESAKKAVQIKIMEAGSNDLATVNLIDDDSDNESVETVINTQEGSGGIEKETEKFYQGIEISKNEMVQEENKSECHSGNLDNIEVQNDYKENQSSDNQSHKLTTSSSAEKLCQVSKSCKRTHDCEYLDIASKRSHLIEEIEPKSDSGSQHTGGALLEWCRQHFKKEANKFTKKKSPLIDRCIESLITHKGTQGNWMSAKCNPENFLMHTNANLGIFRSIVDAPSPVQNFLAEPLPFSIVCHIFFALSYFFYQFRSHLALCGLKKMRHSE